jgi:hypothetical protein
MLVVGWDKLQLLGFNIFVHPVDSASREFIKI